MMEYKGYIGKVEFDPDARILHGDVIGIRDVVTFQGRTVNEVEQAFRESVDDYLAFCKERGEQPDKPSSGQFVLRIDPALHRKATMLATASGKSLNTWVAECLDKEVSREMPQRRDAPDIPFRKR
ncbi:MAG TPA: type II toxin-antitoxin system HicB family antitoxin [Tepidisphaeraceae bacterium]|jgi:predicted HicB family RNase H-like nuclease|nr:type II toxin-antitoxin system HicB family antitoxin [Tepidisphaeraceae bacterium]